MKLGQEGSIGRVEKGEWEKDDCVGRFPSISAHTGILGSQSIAEC